MNKKQKKPVYSEQPVYSAPALEAPSIGFEAGDSSQTHFPSHFHSPTICILFGPQKKAYHLHKEGLMSRCHYFRSRAHFHKGDEGGVIPLEDLECYDAFDMFVEYLYNSRCSVPGQYDMAGACDLLVQLYLLADQLMVDDLKKAAVDGMSRLLKGQEQRYHCKELAPDAIVQLLNTVYGNTADRQRPTEPNVKEYDHSKTPHKASEHNTLFKSNDDVRKYVAEDTNNAIATGDKQVHREAMRDLVSRYAASRLEILRRDSAFMAIIANGGEITTDLISNLGPGYF